MVHCLGAGDRLLLGLSTAMMQCELCDGTFFYQQGILSLQALSDWLGSCCLAEEPLQNAIQGPPMGEHCSPGQDCHRRNITYRMLQVSYS